MRSRTFPFWQTFCALTFLVLILPIGIRQWVELTDGLPSDELQILKLVHDQVLADYVEAREPDELMLDAIAGMVDKLDRHSVFVPPHHVRDFENNEIEGSYEGIGVWLVPGQPRVTVRWPMPGGPAEEAGLLVGDQILAVDGTDVAELPAEQAQEAARELILGKSGTEVRLSIGRDGVEPFDVTVRRGDVRRPKIKWAHRIEKNQEIGYLHVVGFQREMTREFDAAVAALTEQSGGTLRALIVDLRFNAGGLLNEAIELSNRFLRTGEIVSLKRRDTEVIEAHHARPEKCTLPELPLVVLINQHSASASEVFTGAIQDHGRGRVVGVRSYGKGVVQSIYQWGDLDFRLKLTTSHYYTPAGRNIEARMRRDEDGEAVGGLDPDVEVDLDDDGDRAVHRALTAAEVPDAYREAVAALAERVGFELAQPPAATDDPQLAAALEQARELARGAGR